MTSWGGGATSTGYLFGGDAADNNVQHVQQAPKKVLQDIQQNNVQKPVQELSPSRLKGMLLGELRTLCRELNISPAGSKETLIERINEFAASGQANWAPKASCAIPTDGLAPAAPPQAAAVVGMPQGQVAGLRANAYSRPDGQNVGNFITDRTSSRVLAPPGGGSQITFG